MQWASQGNFAVVSRRQPSQQRKTLACEIEYWAADETISYQGAVSVRKSHWVRGWSSFSEENEIFLRRAGKCWFAFFFTIQYPSHVWQLLQYWTCLILCLISIKELSAANHEYFQTYQRQRYTIPNIICRHLDFDYLY
jgi:hypothetical protein